MSTSIPQLHANLQQASSDYESVDILFDLAWEYSRRYLPEARDFVQRARQLMDSLPPYPIGEMHYQRFQASFDRANGEWSAALEKINPVIAYYERHGQQEWLWRAKMLVIVVYIDMGEYALALEAAQEVLTIAQELGDETGKLLALDALGMIYVQLRESEKAIDYFSQAMAIAVSTDDAYMQCAIHHSLTQVYLDLDQFDAALNAGQQAVAIAAQLGNAVAHAYAHYKLAGVYIAAEDYDAARQSLETAIALTDPERILDSLRFNLGLAYVHALMGDAVAARDSLLELLQAAEARNNTRFLVSVHEYLVTAYKILGDYPSALHHSEAWRQAQMILFNEERDRRLRTLEVIHQTRQAQLELEAERGRREQDRQYYENVSKMRDEFIASTTHDLKSPLSSMSMMLYILEQHVGEDPKTHEYVARLSRSLENVQTLITDLLDLASLEALHAVELKSVAIIPFVESVVQEHVALAQNKNISLNFLSRAASVTLCCDQNQMHRVIDNLVSNAIKYTPSGGEVFVVVEQQNDNFMLHVKDNGHGIPAEDLPHIFERFYRVKTGKQADITGTGLGLAITMAIIERHSGTISVKSEIDKGTTFTVNIPLCNPAP